MASELSTYVAKLHLLQECLVQERQKMFGRLFSSTCLHSGLWAPSGFFLNSSLFRKARITCAGCWTLPCILQPSAWRVLIGLAGHRQSPKPMQPLTPATWCSEVPKFCAFGGSGCSCANSCTKSKSRHAVFDQTCQPRN